MGRRFLFEWLDIDRCCIAGEPTFCRVFRPVIRVVVLAVPSKNFLGMPFFMLLPVVLNEPVAPKLGTVKCEIVLYLSRFGSRE